VSTPRGDRYERSDADARPIFLAGFVLALLLAAALAVSTWFSQAPLMGTEASGVMPDQTTPSPGSTSPELQALPAEELREQRAWEQSMLTGTEWIDPVNGVVRIPVERAIELSLREGFPVRLEDRR